MNMIKESKIFKNGKTRRTELVGDIIDTILIMCGASHPPANVYDINIELRRCGFILSIPLLKKILEYLVEEKILLHII